MDLELINRIADDVERFNDDILRSSDAIERERMRREFAVTANIAISNLIMALHDASADTDTRVAEAVAAEREGCIDAIHFVCLDGFDNIKYNTSQRAWKNAMETCRDAIRARTEQPDTTQGDEDSAFDRMMGDSVHVLLDDTDGGG